MTIDQLQTKIYADGAELGGIVEMAKNPVIKGFTTNPTLMRKAGISDYKKFAQDVLAAVPNLPISFEVFSDDLEEMYTQAVEIASWGKNINIKVPVTNTRNEFVGDVIRRLSAQGIFVNVTALMTLEQVNKVMDSLQGDAPAYISVFAGRIADTGRDPMDIMSKAAAISKTRANTEIIWASPRELLNIFQANEAGVQIITVANDLLNKLPLIGKDLDAYSLETVKMFRNDAVKAGYTI
ncbi:transaldolase [Sediminibacterium roseum]|uniref:Transaldolase n=1 Tax=Sediminibacterium roseum TaxID=1978412 RepID=A0ABW9ZVE0_9BACT|nr:transaldolase [Sediminibacterium roseum]NCI49025.1 transaldolase [Sediminibacterium roseum]